MIDIKTVYIQQDNARTHIQPDDPVFLTEAARGGWDIKMVFKPPNSPDTNVLDLGWFASIQSMFQKKMPKTLAEILEKVNQSLAEYPHEKLNRLVNLHICLLVKVSLLDIVRNILINCFIL